MSTKTNLIWSRRILDMLKKETSPCEVDQYGTCITHGQVIEECNKERKESDE